jgi:hypothetical protein
MKIGKVALKSDPAPTALSNCVLALKTPDRRDEGALRELILRDWDTFSELWTGSFAPYLTICQLGRALEQVGYEVQQVADMAADLRAGGQTVDDRKWTAKPRCGPLDEIRISASG